MTLALLCSGQGRQHADMFANWMHCERAQPVFDALESVLGITAQAVATGATELFANRQAQPLVCAATLSAWRCLEPMLPEPHAVLGYSVGELSAYAIAGGMSDADCLRLAQRRADAMDAASPDDAGLTAVLGLSAEAVADVCSRTGLAIAIINHVDHYVLGGTEAALAEGEALAEARGGRVKRLPVSVPSHTPMLSTAVARFQHDLEAVALRAPRRPMLSGNDGRMIDSREAAMFSLSAQLANTLDWRSAMELVVERGARVFLELGPGSALARIARELHPGCVARSVEEFRSLEAVAEWVSAACSRAE